MASRAVALGLGLLLLQGCALLPEERPPPTDPDDLDTFVASMRDAIEAHDWQEILSSSDPRLYQERVVEGGMEEAVFVASLLGLNQPGNSIQDGDELDWDDLDQVTEVALAAAPGQSGPPYRVTGFILTEAGGEMDIEARVTEVQGRLVLTGE